MTQAIIAAQAALKKYFGYDTFRPMQQEIIQTVFEGLDSVVLMPTGGGKSVCYQIPAIVLEGVCVVVSPLIALMKDQVEGLRSNGIEAAFLNSSLDYREQQQVENDLFNGKYKLIYVSPEKLVSQNFLPLLKKIKICLIAVDEAHCISAWGHDFRPEYMQMRFLKKEFPDTPFVALTATADKVTRKDIIEQLQLHEPQVFVASFDRPNLSLEVRPGQKKMEQIVTFLSKHKNESGIIYCLSRKTTEDLAGKLNQIGIKAAFYHAQVSSRDRSEVQEKFINDSTPVICATIAFGMGIDKSNVRWVIHYNLPKNIESYYQEIGRAGRDGAAAETMLFYSYQDVRVLREMLESNEGENQALQIAKLERMQQFAEAAICRREILLNYFGEHRDTQYCGNCDVCKHPPQYFDGTMIAQKALSALMRLDEKVGAMMLIDVLRGSNRQEIIQRGFDKIKTYGAGRDLSLAEWQHYIQQMLHLGLIEVAYDQKSVLKTTTSAKAVLFEGRKIQMVKMQETIDRTAEIKTLSTPKTATQQLKDELFEELRQLRKKLAQERGIPPYLVLTDTTLLEMAQLRPTFDHELQRIEGFGERKIQQYGDAFLNAIRQFVSNKSGEGVKIKGSTHALTFELYKNGLSVEQIAEQRGLNPVTIFSHLVHLHELGESIDLDKFVTKSERAEIGKILAQLQEPYKLKDVFDALGEQISYQKIRAAIALSGKKVAAKP